MRTMSKRIIAVGLGVGLGVWLAWGVPSIWAFEIEGLPGATWGQLTEESTSVSGSGAMGWVNQGIDWITLPGKVTVNTFAEFRYRYRTKNQDFYNAYGPALGLELRRIPFRLGVDYYWEKFPALDQDPNNGKVEYYLTWYYAWDLKP